MVRRVVSSSGATAVEETWLPLVRVRARCRCCVYRSRRRAPVEETHCYTLVESGGGCACELLGAVQAGRL